MRFLSRAVTAAAVALSVGVGSAAAESITMTVTDVSGLEQLRRDWHAFRDAMESHTGHDVEFAPVTSRTAAVELLRSERVDFVLTGPAEYVVMRKLTQAGPVVGFSRPDYFSGVITMADSGITSIEELEGRKVAVGDIGSTSSHLGPMQLLADYGIDPQNDIDVVHTTEKVAYESLKRGDVAAWGTNYMDDYLRLRGKEQTVSPGAFRVLARGPDLPNDVLLAGDHVSDAVIADVREAILDNSDEMVRAIVQEGGEENRKYSGMKFIGNVDDSDYAYIRDAYATIGRPRFAEFVGD